MKWLTVILIPSFLYYCIGCYNTPVIKKGPDIPETLNAGEDINVERKDGLIFFFESGRYTLTNDTLYGEGRKVLLNQKQDAKQIKVALSNIEHIELERSDTGSTIAWAVIVGGAVGIIVLILAATGTGSMNFHL
jgi:hypothetical protein